MALAVGSWARTPALASRTTSLGKRKFDNGNLAILNDKLEQVDKIFGKVELLLLRALFVIEIVINLLRHR